MAETGQCGHETEWEESNPCQTASQNMRKGTGMADTGAGEAGTAAPTASGRSATAAAGSAWRAKPQVSTHCAPTAPKGD